jgi:hypothetical protein
VAFAVATGASAVAQKPTAKIVAAVNAFLATLDQTQRQKVMFAFDDQQQRARWSNFPNGIFQRAGLSLGELNAVQRSAALALVASTLSARGYEKVEQIMDADEVLKTTEGNRGGAARGGGRGRGGGLLFGRDLYFISLLGEPSEAKPWMLQFGGHHLAVNVTIAGEQGILTPTLTGSQPALYTVNGKTIRPLGQESDRAMALLNALDESQRKQAILSFRVADLVLGPGHDGKTIQPEGLKASAMTDRQRTMLLEIIAEWSGIVHESAAAARMAEIKAGLNDTWFGWSGPTAVAPGQNITAYYRIQGPSVVIEYAPQAMGGDPAMHVHTMYRDPTNDYGRKVTGK